MEGPEATSSKPLAHGVSEQDLPHQPPPLVCSSVRPSHPELPSPTLPKPFLLLHKCSDRNLSDPCTASFSGLG